MVPTSYRFWKDKNNIFEFLGGNVTQPAWRGILMLRGKSCRETIFAAQLPRNYPNRGANFERRRKALSLVGERQFGRHFKRQFGWGLLRVKNCRGTVGSQFLPRGIKMARRALWEDVKEAWNPLHPDRFVPICWGLFLTKTGEIQGVNLKIYPSFSQLSVRVTLSGHDSRDWSEYVNVIGVISEPFAREFG